MKKQQYVWIIRVPKTSLWK